MLCAVTGAAEEEEAAAATAADDSTTTASPQVITAPRDERTQRSDGPSVELITGGASSDGAARVGRMPVLD